jgi:hypothetical protein
MNSTIDNILSQKFGHTPWLFAAEAPCDVTLALSESLGPTWSVDRETDCQGEVSIIILPIADDSKPAFVIYERGGIAHVAAVAEDEWEGDHGYASFQDAVAAVITACSMLAASHPVRFV